MEFGHFSYPKFQNEMLTARMELSDQTFCNNIWFPYDEKYYTRYFDG